MPPPLVVAHRGHASRYPENSLAGIEAACAAGAAFVEFDVQLTADAVPVVLHDPTFERTGADPRRVRDLSARQALRLSVGEPARFGERFAGERLCTLERVAALFAAWPGVRPMVEVKRESAEDFGVDATVGRVMAALGGLAERAAVVSFVERAVLSARRLGAGAVGWCLNYYDADSRRLAAAIEPDFVACDWRRLPAAPQPPWAGPWRWMCWEVTDPGLALELASRGVGLIETMACEEMLADPRLRAPALLG